MVVVAFAAFVAALYVLPIEALLVRIPRNYNEGWSAFHAMRVRTGGPLYPTLSEAIFINYPPLSFYVVAALHPFFGDDIFAGRTLALLSEIIVALNIALAARALRVGWPLAVAMAFVFLAFTGIFYEDAVAIDDPQWLGHALQSAGLVVLLRRDSLEWRRLVLVALLCLGGGLAKQSLVVVPLAITCWLAIEDRRALLRWCAICATLVVVTLGALAAAYGGGFVDQVLRSQRSFWLNALLYVARYLAIWLLPYGLFAIAGMILDRSVRRMPLLASYLVIGFVVGIALLAVDGVGYSALFDFTIAAMLGTALLVQRLSERLAAWPIVRTIVRLVPALLMLSMGPNAFSPQDGLRADLARANTWQQSIALIASAKGDVACEMLSLCYWAGRSSAIEFFNFGQYARLHPEFANPMLVRIQAGGLALIQEDGSTGSRRLPPALNAAIAKRYRPEQSDPTTLLVPMANPSGSAKLIPPYNRTNT